MKVLPVLLVLSACESALSGVRPRIETFKLAQAEQALAKVMENRIRFRAVMMTSIAFIFGLIPLVWAEGAAMLSRRAVGTAVFAGMIAASSIGVFLIPMLYVVFQSWRERGKRFFDRGARAERSNRRGDTTCGRA